MNLKKTLPTSSAGTWVGISNKKRKRGEGGHTIIIMWWVSINDKKGRGGEGGHTIIVIIVAHRYLWWVGISNKIK